MQPSQSTKTVIFSQFSTPKMFYKVSENAFFWQMSPLTAPAVEVDGGDESSLEDDDEDDADVVTEESSGSEWETSSSGSDGEDEEITEDNDEMLHQERVDKRQFNPD